jgi:hypothetical protein
MSVGFVQKMESLSSEIFYNSESTIKQVLVILSASSEMIKKLVCLSLLFLIHFSPTKNALMRATTF